MTISRDVIQRLLNVVNDTRRRLNTVESREYVLLTATQTLTNKTLTTPTIGDFTNAAHNHSNAAGGGQLSLTTAVTGILPSANGGTGVNNDARTLTINTNSGTLAFGAASKTLTINESLNLSGASGQTLTLTNSLTVQGGGNTVLSSSGNFTLTIPKTGTVPVGTGTAGRIAEWVTDANTVQASTLAKTGAGVLTLSASGNFTLTIPKTGTVPVGTGTAGRIAEWVTDANTVQASTLAKTGVGVLTLSASGNFTLTVPATGTAALLGTAQTFTENQTIEKSLPLGIYNNTDTSQYSAFRFQEAGVTTGSLQMIGSLFVTTTRRDNMEFFNNTVGGGVSFHTQNLVAARMIILAGGNVGIGETSPTAQLQVEQTNAFGAKPTLRLQQLDLTREFIRFDTTVGAGNPVNTTALGTYYGRVRVWVEGVGEKWLALYNA